MKTKKLYESDGMLARFPARVLSCRPYETDMPQSSTAPHFFRRAADKRRIPER